MDEKMGEYAFLVGVVISLLIGLLSVLAPGAIGGYLGLIYGILALLGLIVGVMNITDKEMTGFLVAAIALLSTGAPFAGLGSLPVLGAFIPTVQVIVGALGIFVAPAALVVALKAIYNMASSK
ncbi:hypothetical protein HZC07_05995 [Candidatus Micrarchaeota archaeon]|nr:hypothetical protein [Candidatus Micrarchaeota archaeon]